MLKLFESLGRWTAPRVRAAGRRARTFGRARQGGVALIAAIVLPPLVLVSLGAVELNQVLSDKRATQDVADAAALMGAQQLNIAPSGADSRAQAFAQQQLTAMAARSSVTVTATILDSHTMKVAVDTQRQSFFGNLFPPGGFLTHAEATATSASYTPLCVLVVGPTSSSDNIHLTGSSSILAPQCLVHSNFAVNVDAGAKLAAVATEAGTTASGFIFPAASTGAPTIQDPFANTNISAPSACPTTLGPDTNLTATQPYTPNRVITNNLNISGNGTVTIQPGDYYFCGNLTVSGTAQLVANDVSFTFSPNSQIQFTGNSNVSLNGRKSGPLAGFLIIADRAYTKDFHIQSDPISNLTGTIYIPSARLMVDGTQKGAASSAWTVLAAKSFNTNGGVQLVINANYQGSDVPVPYGVGNKRSPAYLNK